MSFQTHGHCSRSEKGDLEEGRVPATTGDVKFLDACYPYLLGRSGRASWKLFGYCTLAGFANISSAFFTLTVTTNLMTSDIILWSNTIILSTSVLLSLLCRFHTSQYQPEEEQQRASNKLLHARRCFVRSVLTVILSPMIACLPLLAISWFPGSGDLFPSTSGIPLALSWTSVNALATLLSSFRNRARHGWSDPAEGCAFPHEEGKNYGTHEGFDETDGPSFLPQQPVFPYCDVFGRHLSEELKAALTFTPGVSWENTIEPQEVMRELILWAISVPVESLQPSVAAEVLALAALSIGVCLDRMEDGNQDTQHEYLVSRTCDRLAEIFQQADPSAVPEHAANVFLFVARLEHFGEIEIAAFKGSDNGCVPAGELRRILCCLRSRSASLRGF